MLKVRALQSNQYSVTPRHLIAGTFNLLFLQEAFERAGEGANVRGCDVLTRHMFILGNCEEDLAVLNCCFEQFWKREPL